MTVEAKSWPRAPEDSLLAAVFLSFMATAGLFYVNIMSALVDGLMTGLKFSASQAGQVASSNVYGAALGALLAVFILANVPWRRAALVLLCALISLDMASLFVPDVTLLTALRFGHGTLGGLLVGISYGVIARTQSPDKTFGMLLVVQFGLGGLGLMFLPRLVPLYGYGVLFVALAAFSLAALLMVPFLAAYEIPKTPLDAPKDNTARANLRPLIFTFLAMFTFQAANMGLAAFIIGLGRESGLELKAMTEALGLANWAGILGSALVVVMGVKFGRFWPLLIALLLTFSGTWVFHISAQYSVYFAANVLTAITWSFVIPYLFGMCAAFDPAGRMAALGGFFSKMGLASGPLVASRIIDGGFGYGLLIDVTVAVLAISALAMILPARNIDRQGRALA